jgi:hypothetical protein
VSIRKGDRVVIKNAPDVHRCGGAKIFRHKSCVYCKVGECKTFVVSRVSAPHNHNNQHLNKVYPRGVPSNCPIIYFYFSEVMKVEREWVEI